MGVLRSSLVPPAVLSSGTEITSRDPAFAGRLAARTMLGRTGRAAEIGGPVLFLASRASSFVTGAVLTADGEWTA